MAAGYEDLGAYKKHRPTQCSASIHLTSLSPSSPGADGSAEGLSEHLGVNNSHPVTF